MPPLVDAGQPIGRVGAAGAHPGLSGAVITLAGHDHQAAALGAGADRLEDEFDSCGTAEALVRTVPTTLTPRQVGALAAIGVTTDVSIQPELWSLLGGTEGGLAMQRTLDLLGVVWADLDDLDAAALAAEPDAVVIDGIGGAALSICGIGDGVGPGQVWRAVVDTATKQAAHLHDLMTSIVGPHRRLVAAGGWCASRTVLEAKRRYLGPVSVADVIEAGTLGAATLAARAAGHLGAAERLGT